MSQESFVYFICTRTNGFLSGPFKVGKSSNPKDRLSQLQTGNPRELKLLHAIKLPNRDAASSLEAAFHKYHVADRLIGEWYDSVSIETGLRSLCNIYKSQLFATARSGDPASAEKIEDVLRESRVNAILEGCARGRYWHAWNSLESEAA